MLPEEESELQNAENHEGSEGPAVKSEIASENESIDDDDMIYPDNHLDDDDRYYLFPGSGYDD